MRRTVATVVGIAALVCGTTACSSDKGTTAPMATESSGVVKVGQAVPTIVGGENDKTQINLAVTSIKSGSTNDMSVVADPNHELVNYVPYYVTYQATPSADNANSAAVAPYMIPVYDDGTPAIWLSVDQNRFPGCHSAIIPAHFTKSSPTVVSCRVALARKGAVINKVAFSANPPSDGTFRPDVTWQ